MGRCPDVPLLRASARDGKCPRPCCLHATGTCASPCVRIRPRGTIQPCRAAVAPLFVFPHHILQRRQEVRKAVLISSLSGPEDPGFLGSG